MKALITKTQKLKDAVRDKDWKMALSITRGFVIEFNPKEQEILQIAYECFENESRKNFYKSLGRDIEDNHNKALKLLKAYGKNTDNRKLRKEN